MQNIGSLLETQVDSKTSKILVVPTLIIEVTHYIMMMNFTMEVVAADPE